MCRAHTFNCQTSQQVDIRIETALPFTIDYRIVYDCGHITDDAQRYMRPQDQKKTFLEGSMYLDVPARDSSTIIIISGAKLWSKGGDPDNPSCFGIRTNLQSTY
jgi:hypothetical protein